MPERPIRVLIADDEPLARRGVRQLLAPFPRFTVVGECVDGREVLRALDQLRPDVVFLDVQMPEVDGLEVVRRRSPERMPAVVIVTAYDEYAVSAFEAEAVDYLVKPVSEARFARAVRRLVKHVGTGERLPDATILVRTKNGTRVFLPHEIDWIEAADYYARIWVGARSYLVREALDRLERRVRPHGFLRAHRSALIRVSAVRALQPRPDGRLVAVLDSGAVVPISRRRRPALRAAIRHDPR
jgi:two-component system LytT family response regulator